MTEKASTVDIVYKWVYFDTSLLIVYACVLYILYLLYVQYYVHAANELVVVKHATMHSLPSNSEVTWTVAVEDPLVL